MREVSDDIKKLNPSLFEPAVVMLDQRQSKPLQKSARDIKHEKDLHHRCEAYLRLHGYYPRSTSFIMQSEKGGYYIHLHKTKQNPIILDLLIKDLRGNCIEIELKTEAGTASPEQAHIIQEDGGALLVRDFESFALALAAWEANKKGKGDGQD